MRDEERGKIKVLSYAKVQAVVMAFAGLLCGVFYAGIGAVYDLQTDAISYGAALAFLSIPGMPLYFAVVGFVSAVVGASLFNLASRWVGGIALDIE
jgi:ABC-type dipeptide/oligopeptide/nickel transport system permease subunit